MHSHNMYEYVVVRLLRIGWIEPYPLQRTVAALDQRGRSSLRLLIVATSYDAAIQAERNVPGVMPNVLTNSRVKWAWS
jgi:hypothetical protein